jgi:hypothetical protein
MVRRFRGRTSRLPTEEFRVHGVKLLAESGMSFGGREEVGTLCWNGLGEAKSAQLPLQLNSSRPGRSKSLLTFP